MAAILPTDKPYMRTSVWENFKKRIPWLLLLMLTATFTGTIITMLEGKIDALDFPLVLSLSAFIPMLMSTGGNAGGQSSVTVIRALSLGEIEANVNLIDAVKSAGCIYDQEKSKIVLFYVGDISEKDLKEDLKLKLQRYMLPNTIKQLEAMPLTATGKINRVLLKENYLKERKK